MNSMLIEEDLSEETPIVDGGEADRVRDELVALASNLFAGEARFVELVGQFDTLGGWADGETRSCAHWLNYRLGIAMPAARERVRVARALPDLPQIAAAFAQGRLSYSKVRALTRVATPATDTTLLGFALYATAAQLERICRTWRQVEAQSDPDTTDRQHHQRHLDIRLDDNGMVQIHGSLPTDVGVIVMRALAGAAEQLFRDHGPDQDPAQRRVDALHAVAESFLTAGPTGSSTADHWQITVHTDADTLATATDGHPHTPNTDPHDAAHTRPADTDRHTPDGSVPTDLDIAPASAQVDDGPVLADAVLQRLACDTTLLGMLHTPDGHPIGIGRRTRIIPGWLRRMLYHRDPGCMFPGCPNTRWTDGHHILYWTHGGPTELANLIRLCRHHHGRVHHTGITIAQSITDRTWTFHQAAGTAINPVPPLHGGNPQLLPDGRGVQPWLGDPARLDFIIDALVETQDRHTPRQPTHPDVPAETPATSTPESSSGGADVTAEPVGRVALPV